MTILMVKIFLCHILLKEKILVIRNLKTQNIPKVIGADKITSKKLIKEFYSRVFDKVIEVNSLAVAEASKIYENIFRSINIALVNEMKFAFNKIGIDVWDVIKASSTKPFGFMPFFQVQV